MNKCFLILYETGYGFSLPVCRSDGSTIFFKYYKSAESYRFNRFKLLKTKTVKWSDIWDD